MTLEKQLQKLSIFSANEEHLRTVDVRTLIAGKKIDYLTSGMNTRVFRISDEKWIIKEGRWDIDVNLFGKTKLPFSAQLAERLLKIFKFTFLPTEKEVLRQYELYLQFIKYLGYFDTPESYYHPELERIQFLQQQTRESLPLYTEQLQKYFRFRIHENIAKVLSGPELKHNFLPKEYLLYGQSISPQNKGQKTYFIFQEYVEGELLHDIPNQSLTQSQLRQIVLFIYILLLMDMQTGLIPDTRPRYPLIEAYDWLRKTDNMMVSAGGMKFIDTRWMWNSNDNFIKRGTIIPTLTRNLCKIYLNYFLKKITQ